MFSAHVQGIAPDTALHACNPITLWCPSSNKMTRVATYSRSAAHVDPMHIVRIMIGWLSRKLLGKTTSKGMCCLSTKAVCEVDEGLLKHIRRNLAAISNIQGSILLCLLLIAVGLAGGMFLGISPGSLDVVVQAQPSCFSKGYKDQCAKPTNPQNYEDGCNYLCTHLVSPVEYAIAAYAFIWIPEEAKC